MEYVEKNSSLDFYKNLRSFGNFSHLSDPSFFVKAPSDWWVTIADIQGSTQAIQNGKYKEINLIGAASIACILNTFNPEQIPYVFGGDGATLLIPDSLIKIATQQLTSLKALASKEFGIQLRVGFVKVEELEALGATIEVGKYELSSGNFIAQFHGTGLSLAEARIKEANLNDAIVIDQDKNELFPNLKGLSCRLEPIKPQSGNILTLLVKPLGQEAEKLNVISEFLRFLESVYSGNLNSSNPVQFGNIRWKLIPQSLYSEYKTQKKSSFFLGSWLGIYLKILLSNLLIKIPLPLTGFNARKYKSELLQNCDVKKFDETLRMVIVCDELQEKKILDFLNGYKTSGKIKFGCHRSSHAIMTCMVFSAGNNRHIHFIDGGDGGYSMAAANLKFNN